ncbi:unnamed protein product [Schistosoma curassoni]|uniref:Uncharacterized protein n=1 Tax=Schistosoma curassoni TaxID=6186 RepID=A0A183JLB9_9TREM|nr:unnamed protein product [Schistosoma curassoni]
MVCINCCCDSGCSIVHATTLAQVTNWLAVLPARVAECTKFD